MSRGRDRGEWGDGEAITISDHHLIVGLPSNEVRGGVSRFAIIGVKASERVCMGVIRGIRGCDNDLALNSLGIGKQEVSVE